jgi:glycosyltransferase involved in cell wall biosynthesis
MPHHQLLVPRVSVLMPAYNAGPTIVESVSSALAQSVTELEVIVVDDGSDQPVAGTLKAIGDDRLRVVRTVRNRGVAAARNSGLALARAPIIAQLDADDRWHDFHLEGLLAALSDPAVGLAYANALVLGHPTGFDRWLEHGAAGARPRRSVTVPRAHPVENLSELCAGNPIPSPAVAMRTAAARAVGGYPEWLTVGEDYLLYLRLRRAGWRFSYVDRPSAIYRWPEPSRGATFNRRRVARQQVKLFAALALTSPREPAIRVRLAGELIDLVGTHVLGSATAWKFLRKRRDGR